MKSTLHPLPPYGIDGLLINRRESAPIGVIYYGTIIRKKSLIYNNTDLSKELNNLIQDGNKNIEIHLL